ncbi:MAG: hypothetical protein ACR2GY_10455 [Phycisphaerales bacterium]
MNRWSPFCVGFIAAALVCAAHVYVVQAQSSSLPRNITESTRELSNEQMAEVAAFVDTWVKALEQEDSLKSVQNARRALANSQNLSPGGSFSPYFRRAYSDILTPRLAQLISGTNARAAVDAIMIASRIGTDRALDLVIEQIESSDARLRTAAAGRAILAVQDVPANRSMISPSSLATLARKVKSAAQAETSPYALQRQVELLDAIHLTAELGGGTLANVLSDVHKGRLDVLGARAERLKAADADALIMMIGSLRRSYQADGVDAKRLEGPILARHLNAVLTSASEHWDVLENDDAAWDSFKRLIADTESMLIFIDTSIAAASTTPQTRLPDHWDRRDKPQFQRERELWTEHLKLDPYRVNQR